MPDADYLPGTPSTRGRMLLTGALLLLAGLVCLGLGLAGLLVMPARIALGLLGVVLAYMGVHRLVWAARRRRTDLLVGLAATWLVGIVGAAVLAPWLPLGTPDDLVAAINDPTFLGPFEFYDHPLGTNGAGLDMLARAVFGARTSLTVALLAVTVGTLVGGSIGIMAGYYRKRVDRVTGVLTNAVLAVPPLILLIALAAVLEPSVRNLSLSLSVLTIPSMIRIARANTIAFAQREFVLAARSLGASRFRVMVRELVPNVLLPVLSMAVVVTSGLIVAEASVSYLGLGLKPPSPTWGNMIAEGDNKVLREHPFIVLVPGAFLFLTVFALNLIGERAQKRWDPRSAKL